MLKHWGLIFLVVLLATAGCGRPWIKIHKIDIQQGNVLTEEDIKKIEIGMNATQIHYLLGTPVVQDTFHENRWDYVYYLKPAYGKPQIRRLILFFENEKVVRLESTPE